MEPPLPLEPLAAPPPKSPQKTEEMTNREKGIANLKTPEESTILTAVFFSRGGDAPKDKFMETISEMAQKKSKKPMFFHIMHSQATTINPESAVEWIWAAKSHGAECFFVILPPDVFPEIMDNAVMEAKQAGLRCFLIPQSEIGSKLLYMDLMVELMLIKRKAR